MRRLILVAAAVAVALVLAPVAALAAPPTIEHVRDVGTDTDPDFCGLGQTVDISFNVRLNIFSTLGAQEEFDKLTQSGKVTFTNPANGMTALLTFAGQVRNTIVEGDEAGVHTHVFTTKGLAEKIRVPQGGVLTRDAGLIVERITFDENDEVIAYEASWKGPHPEAASNFELFCEVMTGALGL
jgi:hypothetical protein